MINFESLDWTCATTGAHLLDRPASITNPIAREVRGRSLFAGVVATEDTDRNTIHVTRRS
jgi:hypothetical protein